MQRHGYSTAFTGDLALECCVQVAFLPLKAGMNKGSLHSAQMHVHSVSWPSLVHCILQSLYTLQRTICAGLLAWHLAHKTTAAIMKRAAPETVTTAMTAIFHFFNPVWP